MIKITKDNIVKGNLILINKDNLLRPLNIDLVSFNNNYKEIKLERIVNEHLQQALKEINSNDEIVPVSGYRTLEEQTEIYNQCLIDNGEEFTKKIVALPNTSEHQTGMAIDLGLNQENIDFICPSFPYYGICQEFRKIASKYGFIERYKEDKTNITKIDKEEWHFRYVGYPHSKIIENMNFCLEEYINYLRQFTYPDTPLKYENYNIFYFPYKEDIYININKKYFLSGNNIDGIILTIEN